MRRFGILIAATIAFAALLADATLAAAQILDIYKGNLGQPPARVTAGGWGGGTCSESQQVKHEGLPTLKVDTIGFFGGARLDLGTPVDLSPYFAEGATGFLTIKYVPYDPNAPRAGAPGVTPAPAGTGGTGPGGTGVPGIGKPGTGKPGPPARPQPGAGLAPPGGGGGGPAAPPGMGAIEEEGGVTGEAAAGALGVVGGELGVGGPPGGGAGGAGSTPPGLGGGLGGPSMPGAAAGGAGAGAPGAAAGPQGPPVLTVEKLRLILITTDGKALGVEGLPIDLASYDFEGWYRVDLSLAEFKGADIAKQGRLKQVLVFGNRPGTFYLAELSLSRGIGSADFRIQADLGSDGMALPNETLTLQAIPANPDDLGKVYVFWDLQGADGLQVNARGWAVLTKYPAPGTYTVTATAVDPLGNRPVARRAITVQVQSR